MPAGKGTKVIRDTVDLERVHRLGGSKMEAT